ncbi:rhomboid protease [Entamoeba marina]
MGNDTNTTGQVELYGVDGYPQKIEIKLPANYLKLYGYSCCPCFIPPPCSPANSHRYCLAMFSASFVLSVIQTIMLIVSICIDGFEKPKYNWMLGPTQHALDVLGCKDAAEMKNDYEYWRFVTPIFLHGGIIHLVCNLTMQLRMGMIIERRWNTLRYLIVYFVSGVIGNCFSVMIQPHSYGVGASGALLGLFGGFVVDIILNKKKFQLNVWLNLIARLLISIIIIFVFSFAPGIDYSAHIFGFLGGGVVALGLLCHQNEWINKRWYVKIIIWVSCVALCIFVLVLTFLLLYLVLDV